MQSGFVLAVLFLLHSALQAANWPEWRGPNRDGITPEVNLPVQWSATENVKWKAPLPDRGNSTPVIWDNKVFLTQAVEDQGKRLLICFDQRDGKVIWQKGPVYAEKEQSHGTNPQCSASPATDGERVVAWFGSAGLFCYDLGGRELWKKDLGKQAHEWGYASSPIIHGDSVYLNFGPGENRFLIALDKKTGKERWRVDIEEKHSKERRDGFAGQGIGMTGSWSTPIIVPVHGRSELVITLPDKMAGFDPGSGKELWYVKGLNPLIYTSPVHADGLILGNGGFHGPDLVVKAGGKGDASRSHKLWEGGRTENRLGSAVIKDGYFYIVTMPGIAECIELKTGKKVWEERVRGNGRANSSWSSIVLSGDKLYLLNQSAETIILRASPRFELLQVNSIENEMCNASLAVSNGDLLIRTHKNLWCIGSGTRTASR